MLASIIAVSVLVVLVVGGIVLVVKLDSWRPSRAFKARHPRLYPKDGCPQCGRRRVTTVVSDNRLNGMNECRACRFVWDPERSLP
ncbi:hypothetical protein [Saccharomonospora piscinae]|uniref:hypothetical protein n=1 Tax=Saccharomonospora piscinae TaxID=687388 RepID=UPI0009C08516|nr:hypothetical protein [Saccharomonospora piscinae]TLW91188.1 hypothetical protein FFT09_18175 [Saccharomonospora piscinae]